MQSYQTLFPDAQHKIRGESRILLMTLPSLVEVGEEFELKATMMEISGMPDEEFEGRVNLAPSGPGLEIPERIDFGPADLGRVVLNDARATEPGVYYVEGEVEGTPSKPPRSNPLKAEEKVAERLFWGDIHIHTVFSNCHADCAKDPSFGYWYAKEISHLDFAGSADHLRGLSEERWRRTKEINDEFYEPGSFVTILGFESSHSEKHGGDINAYFLENEGGYFWLDREDMKGIRPEVGLDILWRWLDDQGREYLTVPHHTGRAGKYRDFDLPHYNRENETLLEIFSMWGSSEARQDDFFLSGGKTDSHSYFQDALRLGYKYGVIGSSDTHHTMPGTPTSMLPTPYHHPANKMVAQGLAAVYARELTREGIFRSLLTRNCYATTSTRPILRFSVDGARMGETITAEKPGPRRISVDICTSYPCDVQILRNNEVIDSFRAQELRTVHSHTDDMAPGGLWIRDSPKNPKPFFQYYARAKYGGQQAGVTAWSSPIWIEKP
jgi:hypothetical protein